nr:MAG TPA: hypothetical protein [Caudoviricetes sp.]
MKYSQIFLKCRTLLIMEMSVLNLKCRKQLLL